MRRTRGPVPFFLPGLAAWLQTKDQTNPCWPNLTEHNTAKLLRHDLQALGIPAVNLDGETLDFHSLRHTLATLLLDFGISINRVCEICRHSSTKVTERYLHFTNHDLVMDLARFRLERCAGADDSAPLDDTSRHSDERAGAESALREPVTPEGLRHSMTLTESQSRRSDSNRQPPDYKCGEPDSKSGNGGPVSAAPPDGAAPALRERLRHQFDATDADIFDRYGGVFAVHPAVPAPGHRGGGR